MQTIWILGDQLSPEHAALAVRRPGKAKILMVESKARGSIRKYHQLKLVLVYSAMRHFAAEKRREGWDVDYYSLEEALTFEQAGRRHLEKHRPDRLVLAAPNSFAEQDAIERLARKLRLPLEFAPTAQFLLPRDDFRAWATGSKRLLMENHYRHMRKRFGWLMQENGEPEGGQWKFDPENRQIFAAWRQAGRPVGSARPRVHGPCEKSLRPGAGTPPPELAGRDDLRETVRVTLERTRLGRPTKSVLMVGLRGAGKPIAPRYSGPSTSPGASTVVTKRKSQGSCPTGAPSARRIRKSAEDKNEDIEIGLDFDPEAGLADNGDLEHDLQDLLEAAGAATKNAGGWDARNPTRNDFLTFPKSDRSRPQRQKRRSPSPRRTRESWSPTRP